VQRELAQRGVSRAEGAVQVFRQDRGEVSGACLRGPHDLGAAPRQIGGANPAERDQDTQREEGDRRLAGQQHQRDGDSRHALGRRPCAMRRDLVASQR
jgi:hypothetical protein